MYVKNVTNQPDFLPVTPGAGMLALDQQDFCPHRGSIFCEPPESPNVGVSDMGQVFYNQEKCIL
jgi:hypothetical protein